MPESKIDIGSIIARQLKIDDTIAPDPFTRKETDQLEQESRQLENQLKQQELEFRKKEHDQRVEFAGKIYRLVYGWILLVLIITIAVGLKHLDYTFHLSDQVLITLLTSTTVSVIGLFGIVLKYLFGKK